MVKLRWINNIELKKQNQLNKMLVDTSSTINDTLPLNSSVFFVLESIITKLILAVAEPSKPWLLSSSVAEGSNLKGYAFDSCSELEASSWQQNSHLSKLSYYVYTLQFSFFKINLLNDVMNMRRTPYVSLWNLNRKKVEVFVTGPAMLTKYWMNHLEYGEVRLCN